MRTTRDCGPGEYEQGAMPTVRAVYTSIPEQGATTGVLFDPASITVTTKSPSGVQTTYTTPVPEITSDQVGYWDFTFPSPLTETGKWVVNFAGGGASKSAWFTIVRAAVNV
jgi:hypothetical protein